MSPVNTAISTSVKNVKVKKEKKPAFLSRKDTSVTYVTAVFANLAFLKGLENLSSNCQRSGLEHFSLGSPKTDCKVSCVYSNVCYSAKCFHIFYQTHCGVKDPK